MTEETVAQTTTTPKWRSAWEEQQHSRRMRIRNQCPKSGKTLDEVLNQPHFSDYDFMDLAIVDEAHKLIYCGVPKVIHTSHLALNFGNEKPVSVGICMRWITSDAQLFAFQSGFSDACTRKPVSFVKGQVGSLISC